MCIWPHSTSFGSDFGRYDGFTGGVSMANTWIGTRLKLDSIVGTLDRMTVKGESFQFGNGIDILFE